MAGGKLWIQFHRLQIYSQSAALIPHGIAGIGAQVHHDLVNLGRVSHYQGITLNILVEFNG